MNQSDENSRQSFANSLVNACRGLGHLVRHERNFRIHLAIMIVVVGLGACLELNWLKLIVLLITISIVLIAEAINSAIESVVDLVEPDKHPLAGRAKDIAAGAVLIASINSVIIGVVIFGPPLWHMLRK